MFVAIASGADVRARQRAAQSSGFATAGRARMRRSDKRLAEGEIETLYVLDDWRERGRRPGADARRGRRAGGYRLPVGLRVGAARQSEPLVLQRLGGRPVAESVIGVGGQPMPQTAFLWDPIALLLQASPQELLTGP